MSEKLTYYTDEDAGRDTTSMPGDRGQVCLNCHNYYEDHHGWACKLIKGRSCKFAELPEDERYLTRSMKASLREEASRVVPVSAKPVQVDSEWRVWAKVQSGHCACNIPKHQCKYHGNARV